ncbi:hypothetical protein POF50_026380 [Streptomyces sp. SL13]|uniref:Alanine-rich protein n=1 Tax=Streptantibioticus silvisoli TaxID=2705255 RepID=A0AA90H2F4_9ACTN|nr:hypothetical protein [Streptantibioticus silvisoli]MDI5963789.1 hypothetical protein [Streptantibioticus silvisoli]MDI5972828.1 hypothetical protein [Streptantibioticus silvisoli]
MTTTPLKGANLYPWDVVGDPDCAPLLAGLGIDRVVLATAYHTVRALTPRHPRHKVVTTPHSAVFFPPDERRWRDAALRPVQVDGGGASFGAAAAELDRAGLRVYAWVVLAHNQRLGTLLPAHAVVNAFGDPYPWALCISSEQVIAYCATLAAEAARQPHVAGVELESCGWYGFGHLHAHDKTGGAAPDPYSRLLLSLCFCPACASGYRGAGLDVPELRAGVRRRLEELFAGRPVPPLEDAVAGAVAAMRVAAADRLREAALSAVREVRPDLPVLLHADPDPLVTGANVGVAPGALFAPGGADGVVLACQKRSEAGLDAVRAYAGRATAGQAVAATVSIVSGMGADLADLAAWSADLGAAGATELRYYHAGLATAADLAALAPHA